MSNYNINEEKNQIKEKDQLEEFNIKKAKNQNLVKWISNHVSVANLELIYNCGTYLEFFADEDLKNKKLNKSNFCKNRFCPLCSWRKSLKDSLRLSIVLKYLKDIFKYEFIFLTLTAPNVSSENLNDEIKDYNLAFRRLTKRKEFQKISKGFVRKLEVTFNKERDDFHPHLHIMIAVNKSYFTDKTYISKKKWLELWKECKRDNTITQVDVRKINTDDKNAICEMSKYGAKDADYLIAQDVFDVFYNALKGKRLITYSDCFKEALELFNNGKLEHYKEIDLTEYVYIISYTWNSDYWHYVEKLTKELSEEEKQRINKKLIDELDID